MSKYSGVTLAVAFMAGFGIVLGLIASPLWFLLLAVAAIRLAILWWQIRRDRRYHSRQGVAQSHRD